ncbi:MAG: hypothetical protein ACI9Y7_001329 [Dokdonia sp.]|jgi:hypothetical protein
MDYKKQAQPQKRNEEGSQETSSRAVGGKGIFLEDNRSTHTIQQKTADALENRHSDAPIQKKENNTGLPDSLKSGIENLSGYAMDDVKVHYNSNQPSQLNAHAYAQGTDIHLASGQEKHLAHEAWHVVQQKQGRVRPTMQMKSKVNINDNEGLEKEADAMGEKALQSKIIEVEASNHITQLVSTHKNSSTIANKTIYSNTVQFKRSKNPNRQDEVFYKTAPDVEGTDLTEHHIVPHALLVLAKKKLKKKSSVELELMPAWGEVTVRQMINLNAGWKIKWINDYNTTHEDAPIGLGDLASNVIGDLQEFLQGSAISDDRRAGGRLRGAEESFKGGDEEEDGWGEPFYEWMPGNIVLGPTMRTHDQHDGMALDKELLHLFGRLGDEEHVEACVRLDEVCRLIVDSDTPNDYIERFDNDVRAVNQFEYTPYQENQAQWVIDAEEEYAVEGYAGNQ